MADGLVVEQPGGIPRSRLLLAGAAVLVLLALVVGGVLLLLGEKKPWSNWKPHASADQTAVLEEITQHVGPRYKLASGQALAKRLDTSRLLAGNEQITAIVANGGTGSAQLIAQPTPTDAVEFTFCGTGPVCSLPSKSRAVAATALSESLELALYAFKYVPAIQTVVVVLPPPLGQPADHALVVRRADATRALAHPLAESMGWVDPPAADRVRTALASKIAGVTAPHVFRFETGQDAGGRWTMAIAAG